MYRVMILVDARKWIIGQHAASLEHYLGDTYDVRVMTMNEVRRYNAPLQADCVIALSFGLRPVPFVDPSKVLVFIGSHTWLPTPHHVNMVSRAGGILCCSRELYRKWLNHHPRLHNITFPVDMRLFYPPQRWSFTAPLTVGFAGQVSRKLKGVRDIIIPAVKKAAGAHGKPQVVLAMASNDNIPEAPFIPLEKMREEFYYKIDVLAIASKSEGGPSPAIEAMACGVPVVSNRVGIIPEIVKNRVNGFIVNRRDSDAFAETFTYIVQHPHKLKAFSIAAFNTAQQRRWEVTIGQWKKLINGVVKRRK